MTTVINGSSPSITFSDSTTQASAGLTAGGTIASGTITALTATTGTITTATVTTLNAPSGVLATQNGMTGIAKAWAMINGGAGTVTAGFNVSSVTRNSTGNYTINYTTALSSASYAVLATCTGVGSFTQGCVASIWSSGISTTSANIQTLQQNTSSPVDTTLYFAALNS